MTPYILSLLAASVAAAIVELLAPRGEGGRMTAQVRMVAGLFLLVALLHPLRAGIDFLMSLPEQSMEMPEQDAAAYESTLKASILSLGNAELTAWVRETLETSFGIAPEQAEIVPVWDEGEALSPPLVELCIVLSGRAILEDPHAIESYFADALGCPCRVSVALYYP